MDAENGGLAMPELRIGVNVQIGLRESPDFSGPTPQVDVSAGSPGRETQFEPALGDGRAGVRLEVRYCANDAVTASMRCITSGVKREATPTAPKLS